MTTSKKIYVVEDVALTRINIEATLEENGFIVAGSSATAEIAWLEIKSIEVDLLLCDINLAGEKNGIWLSNKVTSQLNLPVVFLTAYSDESTLDQVLTSNPSGYLIKPFQDATLLTTIKIALIKKQTEDKSAPLDHILQIKEGYKILQISSKEILFLQSEANYVNIISVNHQTHLVREKLNEIEERLPQNSFLQVHKRYIVNKAQVTELSTEHLMILDHKIPISRKFRKIVQEAFSSN